MKFNELCDIVLVTESHQDYLTGKGKIFSRSPKARRILMDSDLSDLKSIIPVTKNFLKNLIFKNLELPMEYDDILDETKESLRDLYKKGVTESKLGKAAKSIVAWMKKKSIIIPGYPKTEVEDRGGHLTNEEYEYIMALFAGKPPIDDYFEYDGTQDLEYEEEF